MDARPVLSLLAKVLAEHNLEAILIGNAAAALHGAPVTTVDVDFLFRKTSRNVAKLKAIAKTLGATLLRPYYPASDLFRLERDDDGLQVNFMASIHGVRSFESLRSRAQRQDFDGSPLVGGQPGRRGAEQAGGRPTQGPRRPRYTGEDAP